MALKVDKDGKNFAELVLGNMAALPAASLVKPYWGALGAFIIYFIAFVTANVAVDLWLDYLEEKGWVVFLYDKNEQD